MKVLIDNRTDVLYNSFYIIGLFDLYGAKNCSFSLSPFLDVNARNFNFIVADRKYSIQTNDTWKIDEQAYKWCDVYGCVNANFSLTSDKFKAKLVPLCPSFGVRCFGLNETFRHAVCNVFETKILQEKVFNLHVYRKFLGRYKQMYCRRTISSYYYGVSVPDYVFFCSTLWYNDEWNKNDIGVNLSRSYFIKSCKSLNGIVFEGGLVPQGGGRSSEDLFADCLTSSVSIKDWICKTKRSCIVFNTPAFWGCHGWKLGEYLAMGKAILSTPLNNDLPAPLEQGKHIHYVENSYEAVKEGVQYLLKNDEYRKTLERGACEYWQKYGTPVASLNLLGIK